MQKTAEAIAQVLSTFDEAGGFISQRKAPTRDLKLEVAGVGPIRFPIRTRTAMKLCDAGKPALHGYKDKTRLDRKVRDTWEINRRRITIDESRWLGTLGPALERIHRDLGLPDGCTLTAQLHNLLVYGPGQFFQAHQDSEKEQDMIGTLVVNLPSQFSGGDMVIEHHGEKEVVKGSIKDLTFIAFYADCRHEVLPVTEGHRVVLTYNLVLKGEPAVADLPEGPVDSLVSRVKEHFETPLPPRWSHDDSSPLPPDRLVYLLNYQYTAHSLGWNRLKSGDAISAAALREAARRLDCQIYLVLADVHETRDCVDDYDRRDRYRRRWRHEDVGSLPEVGDLINSEIKLRHFVGEGRPLQAFTSFVAAHELCYSIASSDLEPFESEHEGYMGNWGNTVDHWYHRAAVVLWPRDRAFTVQAKASPAWALAQIGRKLESRKGASKALPLARQLLSLWTGLRYHGQTLEAAGAAIQVAAKLGDPDVATGLLQIYVLPDVTATAARDVARLLEGYGKDWFEALLRRWLGEHRMVRRQMSSQWLATTLAPLCRALCSVDLGAAPAHAILEAQVAWMRKHLTDLQGGLQTRALKSALTELGQALVALIEGAVITQDKAIHRQILSLIAGDADPLPLQLAVLRAGSARRDGGQALGLARMHARALRMLTQQADVPEKAPDDWSTVQPLRCACERCKVLKRFLASKSQVALEWPLPENGRSHIGFVIKLEGLPVGHSLVKKGRPYSLRLQKTAELFKQAKAQRRSLEQDLTWLKAVARTFAAGS